MIRTLLLFDLSLVKSKTQLQQENVYLRKQLEILNRSSKKRQIKNRNRLFFILMKSLFSNWMNSLVIIKPEPIINQHRKGFKSYWRWKSKRKGRSRIEPEIIQLIKQMANENPQWGVPGTGGKLCYFFFFAFRAMFKAIATACF